MSTKLNCSAHTCVNNVSGLCSANVIHVQGESAHTSRNTQCETFAEKGFINAVANLPNLNVAGELKQMFTKNYVEASPKIKCDAVNCVHNVDQICGASDVEIFGPSASSSQGTECETFKE